MIPNLFDVPRAIFYRKRYKDKQSSVLYVERKTKRIWKRQYLSCGFGFCAQNYHKINLWGDVFPPHFHLKPFSLAL